MSKDKITTLAELKSKEKGRVVRIAAKAHLRRKLLDMGVLPGVVIGVVRHAPLGDPVEISVKGYHLSLRKSEAAHISVERLR